MMLRAKAVLLGLVLGVIACGGDDSAPSYLAVQAVRANAPPVLLEHPGGTSFARRVAATRNMIAVAAAEESAIYIYDRSTGAWALSAVVPSPEPYAGTAFGMGLAFTAGRLAVGDPVAPDGGRVHVFGNTTAGWVLEATLYSPSPESLGFGESVALDRDRLLVGAHAGNAGGSVFAYRRTRSDWVLEQTLTPAVPLGYSAFGWSVDASNGVAVIGAPMTFSYVEHWSRGAVYVFELDRSGWREAAYFDEGPVDDGGVFASHVAIANGVIVVSCDCPDGEAYVFERVGGVWTLVTVLRADWLTEQTSYSHSVAISNGHIFVSAPDREGATESIGTVLRYMRTATGWIADGEIAAPVESPGLQFGAEVAASGEMVVVAAAPVSGTIPVWIFPQGAR